MLVGNGGLYADAGWSIRLLYEYRALKSGISWAHIGINQARWLNDHRRRRCPVDTQRWGNYEFSALKMGRSRLGRG